MSEVLIIADDLTGANDTGVMMAKQGMTACTVLNESRTGADKLHTIACISYSTDSRGLSAEESYARVFQAVNQFRAPDTIVFSKRIDSTLRGNPGAETDAMLDAIDGEGEDHIAIIVPAFPQAGRIYIGGHLLVNGVPLFHTAAAADPKAPINTASALKLFRKQSKYKVWEIELEEMHKGVQYLSDKLHALRADGYRCIIFDAVQEEDLELIAQAAVLSKLPFIAVDPGSFTSHVAAVMHKDDLINVKKKKILFAIGSVNEVAAMQTKNLMNCPDVGHVLLNTKKLLESKEKRNEEIQHATAEALRLGKIFDICCLCTNGIFSENRLSLDSYAEKEHVSTDDISAKINDSIAAIVLEIMASKPEYQGLFCCGGDTAIAVCTALHAYGIFPVDDVVPLAVYGHLAGGLHDGLSLITKGGMVGNASTMIDCIAYFQNIK
ncbi:four-carbon acid sugar kinase family protein [Lachnospiraceae bacterium 54-53]